MASELRTSRQLEVPAASHRGAGRGSARSASTKSFSGGQFGHTLAGEGRCTSRTTWRIVDGTSG